MQQIVAVPGESSGLDRERVLELVEARRRLARLERRSVDASVGGETAGREVAAALERLAAAGRLSYAPGPDGVVVHYTPSRESFDLLLDPAGAERFPRAVHKKQRDALRTSQGVVLRFPGEDGGEGLEVFTTDWSPSPAAAALAVHPDHPWADGDGATPRFSGRYVRHPLTGDLLPVWVADWVRPDFGTGAVLVNPAHDATDLEFGRAIGLPVRFGLVPAGYDGSPATWPTPPVIKTGTTIKTGPHDGLSVAEALERYLEVAEERGLAERRLDVQIDRVPVARLVPDERGALLWNGSARSLGLAGEGSGDGGDGGGDRGATRVRVDDAELVAAAASIVDRAELVLVAPAAERAGQLLALRLLRTDLGGRPLEADVVLVQKVQESKLDPPPEVRRLVLATGADPNQVVVVKQQAVEQAERFLRVHAELLERAAGGAGPPAAGGPPKPVAGAKAALASGALGRAFSATYKLQKDLAKGGAPPAAEAGYFALAYALAGLEPPPGLDVEAAWSGG